MSDLTPEACVAIAAHMNDDHAETVAAYARHFSKRSDVKAARISSVDAAGMMLEIDYGADRDSLRVSFDHELTSRADARATLVALAELVERA